MIFITGPLYSGKRTFARRLGGRQMADAQELAAGAESLERLADELAAQYDVVMATEIGGGIVPLEAPSAPRGKPPAVWPACWPRARIR